MNAVRKQRLILIVLVVGFVGMATAMALTALEDNKLYFRTPTQLAAGDFAADRMLRIGGMVVPGSVQRQRDSLQVHFRISDGEAETLVRFDGILPDLFREGQGVIAQGRVLDDRSVAAVEVLARHDEAYIPRELRHMNANNPFADPNTSKPESGYGDY